MAKQKFISLLAFCASIFALGVISLGAFTRLIDAGLGCPDWPGCYGHLIVPVTDAARKMINTQFSATPLVAYKAWAEMVHRYFVGGLSLFILAIVGFIFSNKALRVRSNITFSVLLILLLIYQIILGQLTVTLKLLPVIVTQHLLGGFLILSTLWLIHLNNKPKLINNSKNSILKKLFPYAVIALILLFMQISLGAWTSTNYASLSCPDFPFCNNNNIDMNMHFKEAYNFFSPIGVNYEGGVLSETIRQTIQMTHRLGALILTAYLFIFMVIAMFRLKDYPQLMKWIYIIFGLLCIQLCLGIANVILKLPLTSAISHTVVAALLLISLITFIFKLASACREVSVK